MKKTVLAFCFLMLLGCTKQSARPQQQAEADQMAIVQLEEALLRLDASKEAAGEAHLIAKSLVDQTRETNKEFRMTGGPKWHNFLIKMGARKKGYCYEWVPELLKALPPTPMKYFERHWGGSFMSMGRENNAVIITKRGAPLETGLVYDAWRGVGKPFWIPVAKDKKYRWSQRFNETQILMGEAKVEPK